MTHEISSSIVVASRFNLVLPIQKNNCYLVFNTLRGSAAIVDDRIGRALTANLDAADNEKVMYRSFKREHERAAKEDDTEKALELKTFPAVQSETLFDLGMLVASENENKKAATDFLYSYWHPHTLKLTLAYTADCQLNCSYCFQSGRDLRLEHSPHLVQRTLTFIRRLIRNNPDIKEINLGLFGGEPLANVVLADVYIRHIREIANSQGLPFRMSLTTNGLALRQEVIERWIASGLECIRITLDGPFDVHDARRPGLSGEGSFDRILRNLISLRRLDGVAIGVSINVDEGNVRAISSLLDVLHFHGLRDDLEIILEPTLPPSGICSTLIDYKPDVSPRLISRLLNEALRQVIEKRFHTPLAPGLCAPCNFVQSNNYIIGWDGSLFRCTFTMVDDDMAVGSVDGAEQKNNDFLAAGRSVSAFCLDRKCAYLPICAGGCRYMALLKCGKFDAVNCQLPVWDGTLPLSLLYTFGLD